MTLLQNSANILVDKESGLPCDAYVGAWSFFKLLKALKSVQNAFEEHQNGNRPVVELLKTLVESQKTTDFSNEVLKNHLVYYRNKIAVAPLVGMLLRAKMDIHVHGMGTLASSGHFFLVTKVLSVEDARVSGHIAELRGLQQNPALNEWDNCLHVDVDGSSESEVTLSRFALVDTDNQEEFDELPQLECPFCCSTDVGVTQDDDTSDYRGSCAGCGVDGPFKATKLEALLAWNTRYKRTCT